MGADTWRVRVDGRSLVVTTNLDLVPGQTLRLKLVSQDSGRWILQTMPKNPAVSPPSAQPNSALMAAFLSRGLPIVAERVAAWSKWVARVPGSSDKEAWAASLESRGQGPSSPMAEGLKPWLAWQQALEEGKSQLPPEDGYWDLWNTRQAASGDPWLVIAVRWAHGGEEDAGLLQAHWSPQAQGIDRWNLTAAPGGTSFRLDARTKPGHLDFTWHFFQPLHLKQWKSLVPTLENTLSGPDLVVTLKVAGPPETPAFPRDGVHVEA